MTADYESTPMRWCCLQHVPFEGPGHLRTWCQSRGYSLTCIPLWKTPSLPNLDEFDGLFVLGGPMNVYEENLYPWLVSEKQLISRAIAARKPILGVCLGAQLLSTVLGGTVAKMVDKEIGWFPVELVPGGRDAGLFRGFPAEFMAFHWHGDAFSIPPRAVHIAKSDACDEQAFVYDKHVVGLQFHLESTEQTIDALIEHCAEDFECGRYIQDQYGIADDSANHIPTAYSLLVRLLDNLVASSGETRSSVDVKE